MLVEKYVVVVNLVDNKALGVYYKKMVCIYFFIPLQWLLLVMEKKLQENVLLY